MTVPFEPDVVTYEVRDASRSSLSTDPITATPRTRS